MHNSSQFVKNGIHPIVNDGFTRKGRKLGSFVSERSKKVKEIFKSLIFKDVLGMGYMGNDEWNVTL